MKKLIVWTMALVFALSVSLVFADEKSLPVVNPDPNSPAPTVVKKSKKKEKKEKKKKKEKKEKKEEKEK